MTDLSLAAQAVNDAAFGAYWSDEVEAPNDHNIIAAAALRAAADHVPDHQMSAHMLYAIADELEGAQ